MSTTWPIFLQRGYLRSVRKRSSKLSSLPLSDQTPIPYFRPEVGEGGEKCGELVLFLLVEIYDPHRIEGGRRWGRTRDKTGNSGKNSFLRKDSLHSLYLFRDTGWNNGVCPDLEISLLTAANNPVHIFGWRRWRRIRANLTSSSRRARGRAEARVDDAHRSRVH